MLPHRIYLSGGGICAMAHVGALLELSKHVPLMPKEWMGVSAGAFVAMCICIGYTLDELYDFCIRFDFTNIKEMDSIPGWILHFGLDTGERLHKLIQACMHVKGISSELTFKECYDRFGLSLRIVATNLNEACPIIFSYTTTPTYKLCDAVRASMTVPYYFQPFICPQSGHSLADGAIISNYPLFVLPKEEHSRTISILIRTSVEKKDDLMSLEIDELIMRPLSILYVQKINIESTFYDSGCIQIMLGDINIMEFSFDESTKDTIIQKGKEAVITYLKGQPKPKRRHSVS
jgi:NTE family protein